MEIFIISNETGMDFGPYKTIEIAKNEFKKFNKNEFSICDENGNEIK